MKEGSGNGNVKEKIAMWENMAKPTIKPIIESVSSTSNLERAKEIRISSRSNR